MYRYEEIENRLNRVGGSLRPPSSTKRPRCEDRTRAGRLAYWTAEVQRDLDSALYWPIAESLGRLGKVREENGRDGRTAMWSAIVVHVQTSLYFEAERTCDWMEIESEFEPGRTAFDFWQSRRPFELVGTFWTGLAEALGPEPAEVIPGIETFCLLASPDEVREGMAGREEVSRKVFQRLTARLRASWILARGRGGWSSPRSCRPIGCWR